MLKSLEFSKTTKKVPQYNEELFLRIKNKVLGKKYCLSVTFVGEKKARILNKQWRKKDYATDILSFPLDKDSGEIIFCEKPLIRKAKEFKRSPKNYLVFLFIHGLFHLKGMAHGSTMESEEEKIRKFFGI